MHSTYILYIVINTSVNMPLYMTYICTVIILLYISFLPFVNNTLQDNCFSDFTVNILIKR